MTKDKSSIHELLQEYFFNLKTNGKNPATIKNYEAHLEYFFNWAKLPAIDGLNFKVIDNYRQHLKEKNGKTGLKSSTQNYYLISLRSFLKFLKSKKIPIINKEAIKLNKINKIPSTVISETDLDLLVTAPFKAEKIPALQYRDASILELLYCSGMKVSEISKIQRFDYDSEAGEIILRKHNDKERKIKVTNQAKYLIGKYLKYRKDNCPYLFVRNDRAIDVKTLSAITPRSIQRLVEKYCLYSGLKKGITPRAIRGYLAKKMLKERMPSSSLKVLFGFACDQSVKRYNS